MEFLNLPSAKWFEEMLLESFPRSFNVDLTCRACLFYLELLKYPIPKLKRVALAKIYFDLCVTPGMPLHVVNTCLDTLGSLIRSKKKVSVDDLRLPWKPLYHILSKDLFLSRRQFEIRYFFFSVRTVAVEHVAEPEFCVPWALVKHPIVSTRISISFLNLRYSLDVNLHRNGAVGGVNSPLLPPRLCR